MTEKAEMTIEEVLSDPLIGLVMRADGVDSQALRHEWAALGATLRLRPKLAAQLLERDRVEPVAPLASRRGQDLVAHCVCAGWARTSKSHTSKAGSV